MSVTASQQEALSLMTDWLFDLSAPSVFILSGAAGTGKTYTVNSFLTQIKARKELMQLWNIPNEGIAENIKIAATTNNAADVLNILTDAEYKVTTMHSLFGWKLTKNPITGVMTIDYDSSNEFRKRSLIIIDEASMLNKESFDKLMEQTKEHNYKVLLVCDLAQLPPVKEDNLSFVDCKFPQYDLTQFVRNSNLSFQALLNNYRHGILTKKYFLSFEADNIVHLSTEEFRQKMLSTLSTCNESKYLSFKNDNVAAANNFVSKHVQGSSDFQQGNIGIICNVPYKSSMKVNSMYQVFSTEAETIHFPDVNEYVDVTHINNIYYTTKDPNTMPKILAKLRAILSKNGNHTADQSVYRQILSIEKQYLDLRPAYAMTVNRSQGQSLQDVFIDLTAFKSVKWNKDLFHRLVYVALSRAKNNVYITGAL